MIKSYATVEQFVIFMHFFAISDLSDGTISASGQQCSIILIGAIPKSSLYDLLITNSCAKWAKSCSIVSHFTIKR